MTPDLFITVEAPDMTREDAARMVDAAWPAGALSVAADSEKLVLGAHDILDDRADWQADMWLLDPDGLGRLVGTLQRLFELWPRRFTLLAAWAGDEPAERRAITRQQLIELVRQNRLGNRALYQVEATG